MCLILSCIAIVIGAIAIAVTVSLRGSGTDNPVPPTGAHPPVGGPTGTVHQNGLLNLHARSTVNLILGSVSTIGIVLFALCGAALFFHNLWNKRPARMARELSQQEWGRQVDRELSNMGGKMLTLAAPQVHVGQPAFPQPIYKPVRYTHTPPAVHMPVHLQPVANQFLDDYQHQGVIEQEEARLPPVSWRRMRAARGASSVEQDEVKIGHEKEQLHRKLGKLAK